jgi:hypothetical protein
MASASFFSLAAGFILGTTHFVDGGESKTL